MSYFNTSEFVIDPQLRAILGKIEQYHIKIINPIRERFGNPIFVSENSGYRSKQWEIANDRDGNSQHTFGDGQEFPEDWWGAADYTCSDLEWLFEELSKSPYKRVCIYRHKGFIHCDHKGSERVRFEADKQDKWKRI